MTSFQHLVEKRRELDGNGARLKKAVHCKYSSVMLKKAVGCDTSIR